MTKIYVNQLPPKAKEFVETVLKTSQDYHLPNFKSWAHWINIFNGMTFEIEIELFPYIYGEKCEEYK